MERLTTEEAEAFTKISYYTLDDVRYAWRYWKDAGDVDGFEAYVRWRIREAA